MWVQSLGWEDSLEEDMETHSSILSWRISWTEQPGRLQSGGHKEWDMTEGLGMQAGNNWVMNKDWLIVLAQWWVEPPSSIYSGDDILGSCSNFHDGSLAYIIIIFILGKDKWQPLKLSFLRQHVAAAKSLQSWLILCDTVDGSPPGSPAPGKNTGVGCHCLLTKAT